MDGAEMDQNAGDSSADLTNRSDLADNRDLAGVDLNGCGKIGSLCCPGNQCGEGTCDKGQCVNCGQIFDTCCPGDKCQAGACCSAGKCSPTGVKDPARPTQSFVCSAGTFVACGAKGQPCCQDTGCGNGLCCAGHICIGDTESCGDDQNPSNGSFCNGKTGACVSNLDTYGTAGNGCLPSTTANPNPRCTAGGLVCDTSGKFPSCKTCGGAGQPCCANNRCDDGGCCQLSDEKINPGSVCIASGQACLRSSGTCTNGGCEITNAACGRINSFSCNDSDCTAPFSVRPLNSLICAACGGLGQPCCNREHGGECGAPYICQGDQFSTQTCVECGGENQACCPNLRCKLEGLVCSQGFCRNPK